MPKKAKKSAETPEKPGDPGFLGFSLLFWTLESLEKPGKHGNSWLSWKDRNVFPRKAWKARRGLWAFAESVDFVHTNQTQEKPGKAGMTVPGVEIPGFHGKAGHANSWKAKKHRTKIQAFLKSWKFALTITVQVSQAQEFLAFM